MDHTEKPQTLKHNCHQQLLDTWVSKVAKVICLDVPYARKVLIPKNGGRLLITGKGFPPQQGTTTSSKAEGKSAGYFSIVKGAESV